MTKDLIKLLIIEYQAYPTLQQSLMKNLKIPNEILDFGSFQPIT